MSDQFSTKERSEIMAKVHSSNTTPEIRVRNILTELGYTFSLDNNRLPGKPDIMLPDMNILIFVHGCFWHGCPTCRHAKVRPVQNADYWNKKLDRTLARDKENIGKLKNLGYKVLVIWECETKKKNFKLLKDKIFEFLELMRK